MSSQCIILVHLTVSKTFRFAAFKRGWVHCGKYYDTSSSTKTAHLQTKAICCTDARPFRKWPQLQMKWARAAAISTSVILTGAHYRPTITPSNVSLFAWLLPLTDHRKSPEHFMSILDVAIISRFLSSDFFAIFNSLFCLPNAYFCVYLISFFLHAVTFFLSNYALLSIFDSILSLLSNVRNIPNEVILSRRWLR